MQRIAVYPGTFDPITHGHVNIVGRAQVLFDKVIIAVAQSAGKAPVFSIEERVQMIAEIFENAPPGHIEIATFSGLLVDFMLQKNVTVVLRGIRTMMDMEYEFQLANMNHAMNGNIETVYLQSDPQFTAISSSIAREIGTMGGDLAAFVPPVVVRAFQKKYLT